LKTLGNVAQPLGTANNVQPLVPVNTVPLVKPTTIPSAVTAYLAQRPVVNTPVGMKVSIF